MDKKTVGIIATVATALLCGCPGLVGICSGALFMTAGNIPGSEIDVFGSSNPQAAITTGIIMLCISLIFVVIPVVVGFFTLRRKEDASTVIMDEPLPPPM